MERENEKRTNKGRVRKIVEKVKIRRRIRKSKKSLTTYWRG